jgi:hypothetical protein
MATVVKIHCLFGELGRRARYVLGANELSGGIFILLRDKFNYPSRGRKILCNVNLFIQMNETLMAPAGKDGMPPFVMGFGKTKVSAFYENFPLSVSAN